MEALWCVGIQDVSASAPGVTCSQCCSKRLQQHASLRQQVACSLHSTGCLCTCSSCWCMARTWRRWHGAHLLCAFCAQLLRSWETRSRAEHVWTCLQVDTMMEHHVCCGLAEVVWWHARVWLASEVVASGDAWLSVMLEVLSWSFECTYDLYAFSMVLTNGALRACWAWNSWHQMSCTAWY